MAFSRQRKHRHDKSKLIFHDFTCCLIIVCHVDPCAGGRIRCRGAGTGECLGGTGDPGWSGARHHLPCVGSLGEVFADPEAGARWGKSHPDRERPLQSRAPALRGCRIASRFLQLATLNSGEAQPCGWERAGSSGNGVGAARETRTAGERRGGGEEERSAGEQNTTKSPVKVLF